jgi:hypothetical protein
LIIISPGADNLSTISLNGTTREDMMPTRWNYLVSETQFATELVVTGIRKLCTVPIRDDGWPVGHDRTYPLHVGLHSYTSGLERLCKLTIACHGYVADGNFPPLRPFGHRIGELLDAVGGLNFSRVPHLHKSPPDRPVDDLDPTLTAALERFANGAGRYEHLDSLSDGKVDVGTLDTWTEFCAQVTTSERVRHILAMRSALMTAIRTLCTQGDLEGSAYALHESVDPYLSESSTGVALRLYEKASWVASVLDALTYYTRQDLPLLGEAVHEIQTSAESFFQYSVALIEDEQATEEELEAHFERFPY